MKYSWMKDLFRYFERQFIKFKFPILQSRFWVYYKKVTCEEINQRKHIDNTVDICFVLLFLLLKAVLQEFFFFIVIPLSLLSRNIICLGDHCISESFGLISSALLFLLLQPFHRAVSIFYWVSVIFWNIECYLINITDVTCKRLRTCTSEQDSPFQIITDIRRSLGGNELNRCDKTKREQQTFLYRIIKTHKLKTKASKFTSFWQHTKRSNRLWIC